MKMFALSMENLFWRFNLLMLLVAIGFVTEYYWIALLALPVFLSCLLGLSFTHSGKTKGYISNEADLINMKSRISKKAA